MDDRPILTSEQARWLTTQRTQKAHRCKECGGGFTSIRRRADFCSARCANRYNRRAAAEARLGVAQ